MWRDDAQPFYGDMATMVREAPTLRFWIVGGEYDDTSFTTLVQGTERLLGPFRTRGEAERAWREVSQNTRSFALARFTIATETVRQ